MKFQIRFENCETLTADWPVLPRLHEHVMLRRASQPAWYGLVHDIRYEADAAGEPEVTVFVTQRPLPK